MDSHLVDHENHEPAGASTKKGVLKADAAICSSSPGRPPLQTVPSNLEMGLPASDSSDAGGMGVMPAQSDQGADGVKCVVPAGCVASEAGEGNAVLPNAGSTGEDLGDSANGALSIAKEHETVPGATARQGLGKAGRVLCSLVEQEEEGVQGEVPMRALQAGARRVECGAGEELEVGEDGAPAKEGKQPLAWFPRAKKDSFLERKIKKMQENEGPKEHLGEAFVKKLSRVEREKAAAAAAAEAALAAKKDALVEVSWCRILEAASIFSDAAAARARAAESRASEAASAAAALGVVLSPAASSRTASTAPKTAAARGYRDVIFASTASEADVERDVVAAVKSALRRAQLTSAELPGSEDRTAMTSPGAGELGMTSPGAGGPGMTSPGAGGPGGSAGAAVEGWESTPDVGMVVGESGAPASPRTPVAMNVPRAAPPGEFEALSPPKTNEGVPLETPGKSPEREVLPRSPPKVKTGLRFGGLLMACISPGGVQSPGREWEDSSSEGEEEEAKEPLVRKNVPVNEGGSAFASEKEGEDGALAKDGASALGEKPLAGALSPGGSTGRPSRAADRYASAPEASDSDDDGGYVASPSRAFSPSRSPAVASPSKVQVSAREDARSKAASPGGKVTGDGTTRENGASADELVDAMVGRLAGLSAEQRASVSSVVATRGFGGFMDNSPLTSRLAGLASVPKPNGLGDDFLVKRSKLEIAKAEAVAAARSATAAPPKIGLSVPNTKVAEPGLDQILVKRLSKLELAKAAAKAEAEKNAPTNVEKKGKVGESGLAEPGLDQILVKKMSKLEKAKAEAVAASKAESERDGPANRAQRNTGGQDGLAEPGLDQILVKKMSKLEKAKADAVAAARGAPAAAGNRAKLFVDASSHSGGLGDMVKRSSRLEREKEAARKAAESSDDLTPTTVLSGGFKDEGLGATDGGFGQGFVKKMSRLEREKAAAQEKGLGGSAAARTGRPKQDAAGWEGQGLGALKKHMSRLEREKLAWKEAEEAAKAR